MNAVRLVSFDVTGTLLKPAQSAGLQYAKAAEKHFGVKVDAASMQETFLKNYSNEKKLRPCFGALHQVSTSDWWFSVFSKCMMQHVIKPAEVPNLDARLQDTFRDVFVNFKWTPLPGTVETLHELKSLKLGELGFLKIAAISNSDERTAEILSDNGILRYFDVVVTSVDAKCQKPKPEIFYLTLKKLGMSDVAKEQVLHVGDSFEEDYQAALNLGMRALLLKEANQNEQVLDENHRINDIRGVLSYVQKLNSEQ